MVVESVLRSRADLTSALLLFLRYLLSARLNKKLLTTISPLFAQLQKPPERESLHIYRVDCKSVYILYKNISKLHG